MLTPASTAIATNHPHQQGDSARCGTGVSSPKAWRSDIREIPCAPIEHTACFGILEHQASDPLEGLAHTFDPPRVARNMR